MVASYPPNAYALTDICTTSYIRPVPSTFAALADPHRRAMLGLMLERPRAVGELVERLGLSQPGTSKHLRVLREAGLVQVRREAQRRVYALDPGPLAELDVWLAPYRRLWNERLDALERHLDRQANREG
jgi:DNA-binding transcriptional ArsR family regulator